MTLPLGYSPSNTPANVNLDVITAEIAALNGAVVNAPINVKNAPYNAKGDGVTDDTAAIQAAITTASAGSTIYFPAGTYLSSGLTVSKVLSFRADDPSAAVLKLKVLASGNGAPIFTVTVGGVSFSSLGFDGQAASQPADGFADAFNTGAGGTGKAYRAAICCFPAAGTITGLDVLNCRFTGCYGACVATADVHQVRVLDNTADTNYFELAFLYTSIGSSTQMKNHQVSRNRITNVNSGSATVAGDGIVLHNPINFEVSDNIGQTIQRNLCKIEEGQQGIVCDNIINTNTVDTFAGLQLQSLAGGIALSQIIVSGNQIYNCAIGITLNFGNGGTAGTSILVVDNLIDTTWSASIADGIAVGSGTFDGLSIVGNTLRNVARYAIPIQPFGAIDNLLIANNRYDGPATTFSSGLFFHLSQNGNWGKVSVFGNHWNHAASSAALPGVFAIQHDNAETIAAFVCTGNTFLCGTGNTCISEAVAIILAGYYGANFADGLVTFAGTLFVSPDNVQQTLTTATANQNQVILGTQTVGGIQTITGRSQSIGGIAGGDTTFAVAVKSVGSIPDNSSATVLTITCPNGAHSALVRVRLAGALGAGGVVGSDEATAVISYDIVITRVAGVNMTANISAAYGSATIPVAGAATATITAALGVVSGAVGATNTVPLAVTIAHGSGGSTNHHCLLYSEVLNAHTTGVTVA